MVNILKMNAKILKEIKSRVSAQVTVKMWSISVITDTEDSQGKFVQGGEL
jgi:hypothetical protein